jgi:DNA-binding beta-propeller fold protein YncE
MAAEVRTRRLYLSTTQRVAAIDLVTERIIWEQSHGGFCCDRLDVSPDGRTIYAPAFGKPRWHAINALDGALIATIDVMGWPRQTIYARDGRHAYLGAWESDVLSVVDTAAHKIVRTVGPFGDSVCPFTLNRRETLTFTNVDGLVGFEVGDLATGLVLDRVIVDGFDAEAAARYECPSHGIALTQDERELWLADGVENRLHIFDATMYPPVPARTIDLRAQPRWITFGIDGRYAYVSTGDVIDVSTKKIVGVLEDERGTPVRSEKMLEIDFAAGQPVAAGRQAGIGGRR